MRSQSSPPPTPHHHHFALLSKADVSPWCIQMVLFWEACQARCPSLALSCPPCLHWGKPSPRSPSRRQDMLGNPKQFLMKGGLGLDPWGKPAWPHPHQESLCWGFAILFLPLLALQPPPLPSPALPSVPTPSAAPPGQAPPQLAQQEKRTGRFIFILRYCLGGRGHHLTEKQQLL